MKKLNIVFTLLLSVILLTTSCAKDGDVGPAGDRGATGPQGPQGETGNDGTNGTNGSNGADGADGETGAQGPPGTANVIYSKWFSDTTFSPGWEDSTVVETSEVIMRAIKRAPSVTSGILDSGIVFSYVRHQSLISPQLLPYTTYDFQINFAPFDCGLLYYVNNYANPVGAGASGVSPTPDFEYRYIVIPGGVLAAGRKMDPRTMSYSEVCRTYNIPQ